MESDASGRAGRVWIAAAVLVAAAFSFAVVLWPARGLTFFWDDWIYFDILDRFPRPRAWGHQFNEHFMPLFLASFDLERALFGANHTLYLVVNWCVHVANVALLATLLAARTKDARAGALAAAVFGVSVSYRENLWWATGLCIELAFLFTVLALLALELSRTRGRAWFGVALGAAAIAPFAWGAGLFAGPLLLVEEWVAGEKTARKRRVLAIGLAWAIPVACYALLSAKATRGDLPATGAQLWAAAVFVADAVGLGFVRQVPLVPELDPVFGIALALAYAVAVAVASYALDARGRARLLVAHAYLAFLLVPMGLTRWKQVHGSLRQVQASHYQYLPAIAWTATVAFPLAAALRRWPRATLAAALLGIAALGWGHARETARDARIFAPPARRAQRHAELVSELVAAAREAREPLYDAVLPPEVSLWSTHASLVVRTFAPDVPARWTSARSPASLAPYDRFPVARELVRGR